MTCLWLEKVGNDAFPPRFTLTPYRCCRAAVAPNNFRSSRRRPVKTAQVRPVRDTSRGLFSGFANPRGAGVCVCVCVCTPLGSARKTDGRFLVFPEYIPGGRNNRTQGLRRSKITSSFRSPTPTHARGLFFPGDFVFPAATVALGHLA